MSQNWRNKPSAGQIAAALNTYANAANTTAADLVDDLEIFDGMPTTKHTPQQIADYQSRVEQHANDRPLSDEDIRKRMTEYAQEAGAPVPVGYVQKGAPVAAAKEEDDDKPNGQMRAQFKQITAAQRFLFAGHAIVTVVSKRSGSRFTFRFSKPKQQQQGDTRIPPTFVSVLTGSDNNSCYSFIGSIFPSAPAVIKSSMKSRILSTAPSAKAAAWFVSAVVNDSDKLLEQCEIWHEGRCGRCGRRLTVPSSIESGFGPECINHV